MEPVDNEAELKQLNTLTVKINSRNKKMNTMLEKMNSQSSIRNSQNSIRNSQNDKIRLDNESMVEKIIMMNKTVFYEGLSSVVGQKLFKYLFFHNELIIMKLICITKMCLKKLIY